MANCANDFAATYFATHGVGVWFARKWQGKAVFGFGFGGVGRYAAFFGGTRGFGGRFFGKRFAWKVDLVDWCLIGDEFRAIVAVGAVFCGAGCLKTHLFKYYLIC